MGYIMEQNEMNYRESDSDFDSAKELGFLLVSFFFFMLIFIPIML
jgi:hypothetical protein